MSKVPKLSRREASEGFNSRPLLKRQMTSFSGLIFCFPRANNCLMYAKLYFYKAVIRPFTP